MLRLEDPQRRPLVKGLASDDPATVIDVRRYCSSCIELTFKDHAGTVKNELLYRDAEARLDLIESERGAQRRKSVADRYHCLRYALRARSSPYLDTAIRKLISASSASGYIWRAAARCSESPAFQSAAPTQSRSEGVISARRRK